MSKAKLAVIYYSAYGTNFTMAEAAAQAAEQAGAEVRLLKVAETAPAEVVKSVAPWQEHHDKTAHIAQATPEDLVWANAFLFSAPTRFGTVASQMRAFIDTLGPVWQQGHLANKPVSAMTSAQNTHGGQESTLLGLYTTFIHWGSVIVAPGFTDPVIFASGGNPYGTSVNMGPVSDEVLASVRFQAKRLVEFAEKLA